MLAQRYRPRFSSRFLLLSLTLACLGMWWFDYLPWKFHSDQLTSGQSLINERDRIHISHCFDEPASDRLITVLGDSRLSHWASVQWLFRLDPKTVVSYGSDHALIIWNYEDGSIRRGFFDAACATYAPAARRLYWMDSDNDLYELSLSEEDAQPRKVRHASDLSGSKHLIASNDGRYLVCLGSGPTISVWDRDATGSIEPLIIPRSQIEWPMACTPNNSSLLVAGSSVLMQYDLASGKLEKTIELPASSHGKARVSACAFSADGQRLTVGDAEGRIFELDWDTGELLGELMSDRTTITSLSAGKDALLAAGRGVLYYHWRGDPRQTFVRPVTSDRITCLSPGITWLGACDERIVELDENASPIKGGLRSDATCFAFSPDGKQIAVAGRDGQIVIRDTHRWQLQRSWKAHSGSIERLVWSHEPESKLYSVGDQRLVAWNPETVEEQESAHLWASASGTVALHPSSDRLVAAGRGKESLVFYKRSNLERLDALSLDQLRVRGDVLFSKDGSCLIAGASQASVLVWDLASEKIACSLGPRTSSDVRLALSTDDKVVYAGSSDNIGAFDLSGAKLLWSVKLATNVQDISRHPSKPAIAAVGMDGAVALYDTGTGALIQKLQVGPTAGKLTQVDFSPDGSLLAIAMSNGSVVILQSPLD